MASTRMQTPLRRVRYLGSARDGTGHFWRQRLTAIANVPLVIAALCLIVSQVGKPHEQVVAALSSPFAAVLLLLLFGSVATHMRLGMQVVIEDYIHTEWLKMALLILNTFYAIAIAALAGIAILKLAFGG